MIPAGSFFTSSSAELLPIHRFALGTLSQARGGSQLNNAQTGINVQDWFGRILSGTFYVTSQTQAETPIVSVPGAVTGTFAFDRNMQPVVCWNTSTGARLYFFNSLTNQFETLLVSGVTRAMAFHDDVRDSATDRSDVLMAYQRAGGVYYRQQRDRYATERLIKTPVFGELKSCGMGSANRLVFRMG